MRRNKYLDDLGIKRDNYGSNFIKGRKLQRLIERIKYGFDYRETVNMELITAEFLYSRLKMLTEKTMDDLSFNHFKFEDEIYTLEEAFGRIMNACKVFICSCQDNYINGESDEAEQIYEEMKLAVRLWSKVMLYADITLISHKFLKRWEWELKKEDDTYE